MNEFAIQIAESEDDLQAVRELVCEYAEWLDVDLCFQGFDEEIADLARAYGPPTGRLYLARVAGRPAGCIGLRPMADPEEGEIKRLYVQPAFQGKGIGRALVARLIEAAREIGYCRLRLDTLPRRMPEAESLYKGLGCVETAPYYHNPVDGVVFYMLDLRPAA